MRACHILRHKLITRKTICLLGDFLSMANKKNETNSSEIYNGSPCLLHGCIACCVETEMPLTKADIDRIEKLGFKRADFTVETEEEIRLRNRKKICIFLENNKCSIYVSRPEGCRIYPLVYDVDIHKFVYDRVCPHHEEFKPMREDKERLKRLIRRLNKETAERS